MVVEVDDRGRVLVPAFRLNLSGYDRGEVDAWIAGVVDRDVRLAAEVARLSDAVGSLSRRLEESQSHVAGVERRAVDAERELGVLRERAANPIAAVGSMAQEYYDRVRGEADGLVADARREADRLVGEARRQAKGIVDAAEGKRVAVERGLAERARVVDERVERSRRLVGERRRMLLEAAGVLKDADGDAEPVPVAGGKAEPVPDGKAKPVSDGETEPVSDETVTIPVQPAAGNGAN